MVAYGVFKKLDMKVVKVIDAKKIPRKNKILKLTVNLGRETRTIIVGGAEYYSPKFFIGKKFVALVNLEPKKISNIESNGMLLAAVYGNKPFWLIVDDEVPLGAKVI